jgi:cobalamin transport system substrate-binding protein
VVTDGLGRPVQVPRIPRRVVSLAPNVTDSIVALRFQDRLVGVTDFCTVPAGLTVARIGGMLNPSLETIRSLRPDLLIATTSGNDPSMQVQAGSLGLPLFTEKTTDVEGTLRSLVEIADLLGDRTRGEALATDFRRRLQLVRERTASLPPPRVLYLVWGDPLVVPGRKAFLTDALRLAGAASVTADAPAAWPAFDLESVLSLAPDVILTAARNADLVKRLRSDPAWSRVPAVKAGKIDMVSDALEQPGPAVVPAIEELARLLHPDAYGDAGGTPSGLAPVPRTHGPDRRKPLKN